MAKGTSKGELSEEGHDDDGCMERNFEKLGRIIGRHPWKFVILSVVLTVLFASGFAVLESELRPDKQWVARTAKALDQKAYVDATWPSSRRFNLWIATCKKDSKGDAAACNLLEAEYLQRLHDKHEEIMSIVVDGNAIVEEWDAQYLEDYPDRQWEKFEGKWSFNHLTNTTRKCYEFGPFCAQSSVLDVFRVDEKVIDGLTDETAIDAINFWETQETMCPVTIARPDSPCVDTSAWSNGADAMDCQRYDTAAERTNCRDASTAYCAAVCPTHCVCFDGSDGPNCADGRSCVPMAVNPVSCEDNGCVSLQVFSNMESASDEDEEEEEGEAPDSAFAFEPFAISTVADVASSGGEYSSASALMGFYVLGEDTAFADGEEVDPVSEEWEGRALCVLGIQSPPIPSSFVMGQRVEGKKKGADCCKEQGLESGCDDKRWCAGTLTAIHKTWDTKKDPPMPEYTFDIAFDSGGTLSKTESIRRHCPKDDMIDFTAQFARSLGDEFGAAILNDISKLGSSYMLMIAYLFVMLSKFDAVHSMMGLSIVAVLIVGFSYACAMGMGGFLGIFNNNLNNNIPFLLLGLGVDDAFVLSSEFFRATAEMPDASLEQRVGLTMRHGGMSILITSATDALAFATGSLTVLPALSWFCQFACFGVIFCFIFQVILFLPCLAINEMRAKKGLYDLFCCCGDRKGGGCRMACAKSESEGRDRRRPRGCICCSCCCCKNPEDKEVEPRLPALLGEKFGPFITARNGSNVGRYVTLGFFSVLSIVGLVGANLIYKDFKLEWFAPDDSYLNVFFEENEEHFASGTPVTVYTTDIDYFAAQDQMRALHHYLNTTDLVDQTADINDWHEGFRAFAAAADRNGAAVAGYTPLLGADGNFQSEEAYYTELHLWFAQGTGARFRTQVKWKDPECQEQGTLVELRGLPNAQYAEGTTIAQPSTGASGIVAAAVTVAAGESVRVLHTPDTAEFLSGFGVTVGDSTAEVVPSAVSVEEHAWPGCTPEDKQGIMASRVSCTLKLEHVLYGDDRYATMTEMREEVAAIISDAFPYSFEFLYWEEVGVIDKELVRNLLVCGAIIMLMLALMIPVVRIAACVSACIILSIVDVVGLLYFWDVTVSGVSTIYILICVGLAVDYSAHIAHMFKTSTGTAAERACLALARIGPSVLNAIISTFLAVVVIGFSTSYVFRIFFKALFLVTVVAGAHGLWLLPTLLAMFGGDSSTVPAIGRAKTIDAPPKEAVVDSKCHKHAPPAENAMELTDVKSRGVSVAPAPAPAAGPAPMPRPTSDLE